MKKLLPVLLLLFVTASLQAQIKLNVKASVGNLLRYGNGYEFIGGEKVKKEYFENLTDARFSINDIVLGLRYEISDPIEIGRDFKGIRKRYIEYNSNDLGLNLRAGDFNEIISRGLSLNVFEERGLGYDTGIDGVRLGYRHTFGSKKSPVKLKAQLIGGRLEYSDFLNPERIETYKIRNGNLEVSPFKFLTLGGNYVYSEGEIPEGSIISSIRSEVPEGYLSLNSGDFQFYASYARKKTLGTDNAGVYGNINAIGDGFYSSLSYSKAGLGVTLDYKNYRFDLTTPDNRSTTRPTRLLPYQNPPTAVREHTSLLISRNPHVVDFNDEVGGQVDIVYSPTDKLSLNLNGSIASRHYEYSSVTIRGLELFERVDRSNDFIPNLDDAFSPFWEVFLESEYYATDKLYLKGALSRQSSVLYNDINPQSSEKIRATTIPVEIRYSLTKEYTLKIIAEQQWLFNSLRTEGEREFYNQFVSLTLTKSPQLSVTFNSEFTTDEEDPSGKKFWPLGEVTYRLNSSNSFTVSYGSERGGLRCTSGICRYINPFEGFRVTVINQF